MFSVAYKISFHDLLQAEVGPAAILRLLLADLQEELEERVWEKDAMELVGNGSRVKPLKFHTMIRPWPVLVNSDWKDWDVYVAQSLEAQGLEVVMRVGE